MRSRRGTHRRLPRQLIFPEPILDLLPVPESYGALAEGTRSASSYIITRVAADSGVDVTSTPDVLAIRNRVWRQPDLDDAVAARLDVLDEAGQALPTVSRLRAGFARARLQLPGEYIVGSKTSNHYVRATIHADGSITGIDPQNGHRFADLPAILRRLGTIDFWAKIRAPIISP